jgi:hypothetical protein
MKKIIILFLGLALFGCKDDEVTTPKTAALTINLDELFDRPWYIVEERDFITSEFQFTSAGVYADPNYGNGTWEWQDEANNVMLCDRNGEFLVKLYEVTGEKLKFKLIQPIEENPDWSNTVFWPEYKSEK